MSNCQPDDLILFRDGANYGVMRVELVRNITVTGFPWLMSRGRFDLRRKKVKRFHIIGRLSKSVQPDVAMYEINALANMRDAKRSQAQDIFDTKVRRMANA